MENKNGNNAFKFILMFCGGFLLGILALIGYQSYIKYDSGAGQVEEQVKESINQKEETKTGYNGPKGCDTKIKRTKLTNKEFNQLKKLEVCTMYEIDKLNTIVTPTKILNDEDNVSEYHYEFEVVINNKIIPYDTTYKPIIANLKNNIGIIVLFETFSSQFIYNNEGDLLFDSDYVLNMNGGYYELINYGENGTLRYSRNYVASEEYFIDGKETINSFKVEEYCGTNAGMVYVIYDLILKNGRYELVEISHEC